MIQIEASLRIFQTSVGSWNRYGIFIDGRLRFYSIFGRADAGKSQQLRRILAAHLEHKKKKEELL